MIASRIFKYKLHFVCHQIALEMSKKIYQPKKETIDTCKIYTWNNISFLLSMNGQLSHYKNDNKIFLHELGQEAMYHDK